MRRGRLLALSAAGVLVAASTCTAAGVSGGQPTVEAAAVVHQGVRIELPPLGRIEGPKPEPRPSFAPPVRTTAPAKPKAVVKVKPKPKPTKKKSAEKVTRISGYVFCGSAVAAAQRCIDQGKLTLYYPAGVKTLAGHNYMGWSWMDDLPVGRKVVIASGGLKGTYRVYGHGWAKRGSQGGTFPKNGLGASVALQTCTSNGTGFSFLRRT